MGSSGSFETGWLKVELEAAEREVATWSEGMRRQITIRKTNPSEQQASTATGEGTGANIAQDGSN